MATIRDRTWRGSARKWHLHNDNDKTPGQPRAAQHEGPLKNPFHSSFVSSLKRNNSQSTRINIETNLSASHAANRASVPASRYLSGQPSHRRIEDFFTVFKVECFLPKSNDQCESFAIPNNANECRTVVTFLRPSSSSTFSALSSGPEAHCNEVAEQTLLLGF